MIRFSVLLVALVLFDAATAQASWRPARVLARDAAPRGATALPGGGLALFAGTRTAERFTWTTDGAEPQRTALPAPSSPADPQTRWTGNARGDVLLVGRGTRGLRVVAVDATGARATFSGVAEPDYALKNVAAAIGDDGTGVVAWTAEAPEYGTYADFVWVTLRAPGGSFGPAIAVPAGSASRVAAAVRPDGTAELAFDGGDGVSYTELRPGEPAGVPVTVVKTEEVIQDIALVGGGPGRSRVMILERALTAVLRAPDGRWGAPQVIGRGLWAVTTSLAGLADGGALLAYGDGRAVMVRRAGPGAGFGDAERVGRVGSDWAAFTFAVATSSRGDALVGWIEASEYDGPETAAVCYFACHERVLAAAAAPGGRFGAPQTVSPLGTMTGEALILAVSETGERLVAWQAGQNGVHSQGALLAARGAGAPDPALRNTRAPRLTVEVSRAALVAAAAGRRLRGRVGCSEACSVRVNVLAAKRDDLVNFRDLAPVIRSRPGTRPASWVLTRGQRRELKRLLATDQVRVTASATDAAGNITELSRRPG